MEIKLPLYDLLNRFLIGLVFIGCVFAINISCFKPYISKDYFETLSVGPEIIITICIFAISYEVGFIINRIGSIALEPFLKKTHLISFNNDYKLFNKAKVKYPIMETLSREYALSRTSTTLFLLLTIIALVGEKKILSVIFVLFAIIFCLSCRKFAKKIVELMEKDLEKE